MRLINFTWMLALILSLSQVPLSAQEKPATTVADPAGSSASLPNFADIEHVYVPESQLGAIFKQDELSAVMPLAEFEALVRKARVANSLTSGLSDVPHCQSAELAGRIEGDLLLVDARFQINSNFPHGEIDLSVKGWNVLSATLDDQPAAVARVGADANTVRLFVPKTGSQTFRLQLACPLKSVGNDQLALAAVPGGVSGQFSITLPAGKHLRLGSLQLKRKEPIDQPSEYSIPVGGMKDLELVMTDRQQGSRLDVLTFASTAVGVRVEPGEMTWSARTELQVFGQAIDRLVCGVPASLEITRVESEGLDSWELNDDPEHPGRVVMTLKYHQAFEGDRSVYFQGILSANPDQPWLVPDLTIAQVTSHTGIVVIGHPANLRLQPLETQGVRAVPQAVGKQEHAELGAEQLRYQVWQEQFVLKFVTALKQQQVQAAMTTLLFAGEQGLDLDLTLSLQTRQVPLFDARIQLPADYHPLSITRDGNPVQWTVLPMDAGVNEVRIALDPPLSPQQTTVIVIQAQNVPEAWPVQETPVVVAIPRIGLPQAEMMELMLGISAPADLEVVPQELTGLDPATRNDMDHLNQRLAATGQTVQLGFSAQDTNWKGQLQVTRKPTLFTTSTISYFRVDRETIQTHLSGRLSLSGGGIRELKLQLSEAAGDKLRFRIKPVDGLAPLAQIVEQVPGEVVDGQRDWTLRFDRYLQGEYELTTSVQLPRAGASTFSPPCLTFPQASAQSGFIAIEGPPDEQVRITAQSADGQALTTVDPVDLPASEYHPQERIVAGFRFVRPDWNINVTTTTFQREAVPAAVGHQLQLASVWSPGVALQHQAIYDFSAVGMQSLIVLLPAEGKLWSAAVDGHAVEARQSQQGIHIPLVGIDAAARHQLTLVFETSVSRNSERGGLQMQPPAISVIAGNGDRQTLEILQQSWEIYHPEETILVKHSGAFRADGPGWQESLLGRLLSRGQLPGAGRMLVATSILTAIVISIWLGLFYVRALRVHPVATAVLTIATVFVGFYVFSLVTFPRWTVREYSLRQSDAQKSAPEMELQLGSNVESFERMLVQDKTAAPEAARPVAAPSSGPVPSPIAPPTPVPDAKPGNDSESVVQQVITAPAANSPVTRTRSDGLAKSGLLSMNLHLQVPEQSRMQRFSYQGNSSGEDQLPLQVQYASRSSLMMLLLALTVGTLLLGWWLRRAPFWLQSVYLLLAIVLPLGLMAIVPLIICFALQSILLGGGLALLTWGLVHCPCLSGSACWPRKKFVRNTPLASLIILLATATATARGDEPAFKALTPAGEGQAAADPHVVIPYKSLAEIPAADRVYVPAALFKQLWQAAHPEELKPKSPTFPVTVTEANIAAKFVPQGDDHVLHLQLRWVVSNLTEQPQVVPLPLKASGLQQPLLDGAPALLQLVDEEHLGVLIEKQGTYILDAELTLPDVVRPDRGSLQLKTLPVASGLMTLEIPSTADALSLSVNRVSGKYQREVAGEVTRFQIPIDRGGDVTVRWQTGAGTNPAESNLQLETAVLVAVEDTGVRLLHHFDLNVRQGTVNELTFELPAQTALRQVSGTDVSGWELEHEAETKRLKVVFTKAISDRTRFQVELFQSRKVDQESETFQINTLAAVGTLRETGIMGIAAPDHLRLRVLQSESLQQTDVAQVEAAIASFAKDLTPQAAFRYIVRPYQLKVEVSRRDAEIRAAVEHGVLIGRRKTIVSSKINLSLSGPLRNLIVVRLPNGYQTLDVFCPQAVDWYVTTGDESARLLIELDDPRSGSVEIGVRGQFNKNSQDENLAVNFPVPAGASRSITQVGVWCDEAYQATLSNSGNWKSVSENDVPEQIRHLQPQSPQFAFQTSEEPAALEFQLKRAIPETNGDAGILIAAGDATIDYGLTLRWNISRAATDQFAFTVPSWLGHLDFTGPGIRQIRSEPVGDDRTRWLISLIDPVRGQYLITAAATIAIPVDLTVQTPRLEFENMNDVGAYVALANQRQFAVLVNLSQTQLSAVDVSQFESVAIDQLPLSMPPELVQQAMEIVRIRPQKLPAWKMQHLERASTSQAVVPSCTLRTVLQMDGSWRTEVMLGVRNRGQQFLALKFPKNSKGLSVFVRGVPARTVASTLGDEPIHLVALPQTSAADLSFDVSLLLAGRLDAPLPGRFQFAGRRVQLPSVQVVTPKESAEFGVSVAQTVWNVYIPDELEAFPSERYGMTNVTFHHGAGWIAAQSQMIERIRGDIAEMKRIAVGSGNYSDSQRTQALNNLRELRDRLRTQQDSSISDLSSSASEQSSVSRFQIDNGLAIRETEEALRDAEQRQSHTSPAVQSGAPASQQAGAGNRSFINLNNEFLLGVNSRQEQQKSSQSSSENFSFYVPIFSRDKESSGNRASEEQESRAILKQQLQSQSLSRNFNAAGQAGDSAKAPDNIGMGRRILPRGTGDQGGAMGGGINVVPSDPMRRRSGLPMDEFLAITPDRSKDGRLGDYLAEKGIILSDSDRKENADQSAVEGVDLQQRPGAAPQGLSVAMSIPESGHELSFDKPGGNPTLMLTVRPRSSRAFVLGGIWALTVLIVGLQLLRNFARTRSLRKIVAVVSLLGLISGGALFVTCTGLPAAMGLAVFCLSGFVWLILASFPGRPVTSPA